MPLSPRILSAATAEAAHCWSQLQILDSLAEHFPVYRREPVRQVFLNSGIETRRFVLGPGEFQPAGDADELHAVYREHSLKLAREAACAALRRAGLTPGTIDFLVVATCTGYLCPGLTARLAAELGMRDDLERADLVGMGCSGAMPALQRASDFVRAYPERRALVVCVEISSACWFVDETMETVVGNAICADGAAAAVLGMDDGPGPRLERFATVLDSAYLDSVGLEQRGGKQRIILAAHLRQDAGPLVRRAVERLLAGESPAGVDRWVVHSGGRKVLDGIAEALELGAGELRHSRDVLRGYGNMSSPTVLFVLERTLAEAKPGETGVMAALGPGLAAETALLRW